MTHHGGGTASMLLAAAPECRHPDYSALCTYRDSIRRVSVSGGVLRGLALACGDTGAGEESSSASSSASSPALDASARRSSVSSSFSDDSGLCFSSGAEWGAANPDGIEELRAIARRMVHDGYMQSLIRAFGAGGHGHGLSSPAHYDGGPGPGGLEELFLGRWFSELDVEWVLHTGNNAAGGGGDGRRMQRRTWIELEDGCASLLDLMERWIKALKTMVQVLCITQLELRAKKPAVVGGVRKAIRYLLLLGTGRMAEHEQEVAQFVRFSEASVLRMLGFVDAVADVALNDDGDDDHRAAESLPAMLQVYNCVVDDSPTILALFKEAATGSDTSIFEAMNSAFLRKRNRLSDAIWSMMDKARASFVTDDCWRVSPEEAGGIGIHRTTRLMMNYVTLLSRNEGALSFVLEDQQHRLRTLFSESDYYSSSAVRFIRDLISCLEKQLEKTSNFITDPGLRYIFLMNNCSFVSQRVSSLLLPSWTLFEGYKMERSKRRDSRRGLPPMEDYVNQPDPNLQEEIEMDSNLDGLIKIQRFIDAYLDSSWEPVMSCLYHDIPCGFLRLGGMLDKFEYEFRRTCDMQRLWKVPNPELRKRLRKVVIEKVIPGYSKYLAERTAKGKSNSTPKNTAAELEELLEDLFEG